MVRRKKFDVKKWLWIAAIPPSLGAIGLMIVKSAEVINIPKRVEAAEKDIVDLKDVIQQQQTINDYYYKKEQKDVIYSPDGTEWVWDEKTQKWLPVKGGK